MASIPPFQRIIGKIGSVTVSGRGPGSGSLAIYVDGHVDQVATQLTAWISCTDQIGKKACYPHIFQGYLAAAVAAQKRDATVELLYYNVIDDDGPHKIISELIVFT